VYSLTQLYYIKYNFLEYHKKVALDYIFNKCWKHNSGFSPENYKLQSRIWP